MVKVFWQIFIFLQLKKYFCCLAERDLAAFFKYGPILASFRVYSSLSFLQLRLRQTFDDHQTFPHHVNVFLPGLTQQQEGVLGRFALLPLDYLQDWRLVLSSSTSQGTVFK